MNCRYGGTNFGFTAGANGKLKIAKIIKYQENKKSSAKYNGEYISGGLDDYQADLTSYDYDAPMDESGDPTVKYMLIRDVIKEYLPLPNISIPTQAPKIKLPPLQLTPLTTLLSPIARRKLVQKSIQSEKPLSFEELEQNAGFVLYEIVLPNLEFHRNTLLAEHIHDLAIVLVDDVSHNKT